MNQKVFTNDFAALSALVGNSFVTLHRLSMACIIVASIPASTLGSVQKDSLDVRIIQALDDIYNDFYFADYFKAAEALDRQIEIASKARRWHMVLSGLTLKAKCAYNHYLADKTYSILLQAESVAEEYRQALDSLDPVREYRSEINYVRGMHFHEVGDFSRSISSFEIIIDNQRKYKGIDPFYLYYVYSFIGHASLQLMLFDKAYLNYEEASAMLIASQVEDNSYQLAMGNLYKGQCKEYKAKNISDQKLAHSAMAHYKEALRILLPQKEKISYKGALMSAYTRLAATSSFMNQYDSAIYYLHESIKFQGSNEPTLSGTYSDFGDLYMKQHKYSLAKEYFDKGIAIANAGYQGKHFRKVIPMLKKTELLLMQQNFLGALETCQVALSQVVKGFDNAKDLHALPAVDREANIDLVLDGLTLKGRIHLALYKKSNDDIELKTSLASYQTAIEVIEDAQKRFPEGEYKQTLAAKAHPLYEYALDAAFTSYEKNPGSHHLTELIFKLLESNKSTMLRDASTSSLAFNYQDVPTSTLEKESILKGSIASMRARLYENPVDSSAIEWKRELYALTRQYDSILTKIRNDHPRYFELKYGDHLLSIDEAKAALAPETLMLEYFWGDRSIYILGLSKSHFVVKRIALYEEIKNSVSDLIKLIGSSETDSKVRQALPFAKISNATYTRLLKPVIDAFADELIRTLVIIPDGLLAYLPFDLLVTSHKKEETTYGALSYLLRSYVIRNIFSASELLANDTKKSYSVNYMGFAPDYSNFNWQPDATRGKEFGTALTHNVEEITAAASFFDGKVFTQNEATEETFRTVSGDGKMLHLSMHGFVNDLVPSFSALLFTSADSSDDQDANNDGVLHLHELYNIAINAELAVLSACETGTGRFARGEGSMSLGRAFRYAGCENIIMSLWKVNDNTTARLMKELFSNLNLGMGKDEALRQAKLDFINNSENKYFTHPYYWSGFVLTGDSAPVFDRSRNWYYIAAFSATIVIVFVVIIYFKRKKPLSR
ncbi:MAG TPA: CHAT domain-containing protein [Chryseolinea sp.]